LLQRDLIKNTLGQFVDPRIADALLMNPSSLRGQRVVQSAMFCDLENFTSISEKLDPELLVQLLGAYLGAVADVVRDLNGYLDKFLGDGAVAFWGPPVESDHALAACRAALRIVELPRQFETQCRQLGIPPLRVRVGCATGEALVGIVGSETGKKDYTAMGDVMNLASRLEGVNKLYGTQILVNGTMAKLVEGRMATRMIDVVRVMGRAEPVELYEVLQQDDGACERYAAALSLYQSRKWDEAQVSFAAVGDGPSHLMSVRCRGFAEQAPDGNWDGVWNLDRK
jgi:adenylate cyclase